jgi:GDP-L-fucose synthase
MFNWKNKKVLVTGAKGMIGKELIKLLYEKQAEVYEFDIKENPNDDVTSKGSVEEVLDEYRPDYVFHLFGVKGNPKMTKEKPVDFMYPMLVGDANMIYLANKYKVKRFLYTSSIAVENLESDLYPATAKLTSEKLIEAMRMQYPKGTKYCIVRPANVYGKEDISRDNLMVVSSLIKQALKEKRLVMDINGSKQERDIIYAQDVAVGMIKAMENMPVEPVNLCSGKATSIKQIGEAIAKELSIPIVYKNLNLVLGPQKKVMNNPYWKPKTKLNEGIHEVIKYVSRNTTLQ